MSTATQVIFQHFDTKQVGVWEGIVDVTNADELNKFIEDGCRLFKFVTEVALEPLPNPLYVTYDQYYTDRFNSDYADSESGDYESPAIGDCEKVSPAVDAHLSSYGKYLANLGNPRCKKYLCQQSSITSLRSNIKTSLAQDMHILKKINGSAVCKSFMHKYSSYDLLGRIMAQDIMFSVLSHGALLIDVLVVCKKLHITPILDAIEDRIDDVLSNQLSRNAIWHYAIHRPKKMVKMLLENVMKVHGSVWIRQLVEAMIHNRIINDFAMVR
jgi:hypothetical protein